MKCKWFSVKDELPTPYEDVLVTILHDNGFQYCDVLYMNASNEWELERNIKGVVTHWTPLPDFPDLQKEDEA